MVGIEPTLKKLENQVCYRISVRKVDCLLFEPFGLISAIFPVLLLQSYIPEEHHRIPLFLSP